MIKANFNAYNAYVTDSLYQWDINQVLTVSGLNLTVAPEVHFSNANMERAIVRQAKLNNGSVLADIPNSVLQDPLPIYAHIGIYEGSTFKVVEYAIIPVIPRKRPADYQIEDSDEEIYSFKALENAIHNMVRADEAAAISARIDSIIANTDNTDGNSELMDIRADIHGNVHGTAGTAVRSQIRHLSNALYKYTNAEFVNPGYINLNGEVVPHVNWFHTDFIEYERVVYAEVYQVQNLTAVVCYYDEDKNFISSQSADANASLIVDFSDKPSDAKYVRFCSQLIDIDTDTTVILSDSKVNKNSENIERVENEIGDLQNRTKQISTNTYISVFYDRFVTEKSDWTVFGDTDSWVFDTARGCVYPTKAGGYVNNTLTNVLGLNRMYEADKRVCRVVAELYSDTVMNIHFYRAEQTGQYPNEGMYTVDCANGLLKMCALNGRYVQPDVFAATADFAVVNGNRYIIELEKDDYTFYMRIIDFLSGNLIQEVSVSGWAAGTQIQYYGFSLGSGTPFKLHSVNVSILNNPTVCFVGDSITEGHGMTDNMEYRFAELARKAIGNSIISAGSSDTISTVFAKFESEYKFIKPKTLFVTIGTNGTPTQDEYNRLKQLCDEHGIALILAHIPANSITGTSFIDKNKLIDTVGVMTCHFDIATSIDHDITKGVNTSLTTDGTHVNTAGSLAMFERIKIDTDLIY